MSQDDSDDGTAPLDVVVGVGRTDDGEGVNVVRLRDRRPDEASPDEAAHRVIELGELRRMQAEHALPTGAELVKLAPRAGTPAYDVEVVVPRQRALSGPPQVATPTYRANWSATFGDEDLN